MLIFTKFKNIFFQELLSLTAYGFLNELQEDTFYIGHTVFIDRPLLAFK